MGIYAKIIAFLAVTGALAQAESMDVVIKVRQRVSMAELARSVSDPESPRYGVFYTPKEIKDLVAPRKQEYRALLQSLRDEGLQIVSQSPTHLYITVRGDSAVFENLFNTQLLISKSEKGELSHQPMQEAEVPAHLDMVQNVIGLDNTRKSRHHHSVFENAAALPGGTQPATIKTVYGFDPIYKSGVTGNGQHIAIASYDGFNLDDVKQYYKLLNLPLPAIDQVLFNGAPAYNEDSAGETQLDAEFAGMIAPGAKIHVFASAANNDAGELQLFTAILDDNRAKIINYSWGDCEKNLKPAHKTEMLAVFQRAIAQGVNIVAASGDSGSDGCRDGTKNADWPAANPNIVAVGGTSLTVKNNKRSETAWSGSGGGISDLFARPAYQSMLPSTFVRRSFPDVAFNADPKSGQALYAHVGGVAKFQVAGGTSIAAPQMAGFLALVAEARAAAGLATLGFFNPRIYAASASARQTLFNDIVSGKNGVYSAGKGYDAVTGLGSLQAAPLLSFLLAK